MLRCAQCGCSRFDSNFVGCVLCGGSPALRSERCHITEDTKIKLLAQAEELKRFGITVERLEGPPLQKYESAFLLEVIGLTLEVADSLHHGVLRKLVVFLREKKIAEEQIRRLRLDEPETILAYYGQAAPTPRNDGGIRSNHGRNAVSKRKPTARKNAMRSSKKRGRHANRGKGTRRRKRP